MEWDLAWRSFLVEAVIALIIIYFLRRIDKRNETKEDKNTQKIIDALNRLGDRLEDKIDGKSSTDKPRFYLLKVSYPL
jgi:hypothetical protein